MNKKIFFVATVAASLAVLPSCKNEVDDLFDQSAADRIEQAMTDYNEALCSAENGWVIRKKNVSTSGRWHFCTTLVKSASRMPF